MHHSTQIGGKWPLSTRLCGSFPTDEGDEGDAGDEGDDGDEGDEGDDGDEGDEGDDGDAGDEGGTLCTWNAVWQYIYSCNSNYN